MKAYIAPDGLNLLATAQSNAVLGSLALTGYAIGDKSNFVPDVAMKNVQGNLLVDKTTRPIDVFITPLHHHEVIFTVKMDRVSKFQKVGNILLYLNNKPFIWNVSSQDLPKENIDRVAHSAGDEYVFPILFRYPFINSLLSYTNNLYNVAKFPIYEDMSKIIVTESALCDQMQVDKTDTVYGGDRPFIANRIGNHWRSIPLFDNLNTGLKCIDGGRPVSGQ